MVEAPSLFPNLVNWCGLLTTPGELTRVAPEDFDHHGAQEADHAKEPNDVPSHLVGLGQHIFSQETLESSHHRVKILKAQAGKKERERRRKKHGPCRRPRAT